MSKLPFHIEIVPGSPAYEQVVHAVHRSLAAGILCEGDAFPSVRTLGKAAGINPNTAHKVVQALVRDGTLEVLPGRGTRIAPLRQRDVSELRKLIADDLQRLTIESKRIGLTEEQLLEALSDTWEKLKL